MHQPVGPGADSGEKLKFSFEGDRMKLERVIMISAPSAKSAKSTVTPKHGRRPKKVDDPVEGPGLLSSYARCYSSGAEAWR